MIPTKLPTKSLVEKNFLFLRGLNIEQTDQESDRSVNPPKGDSQCHGRVETSLKRA